MVQLPLVTAVAMTLSVSLVMGRRQLHEKPPAAADVVFTHCAQADSWTVPADGQPGTIQLAAAGDDGDISRSCWTLDSAPRRFAFVSASPCDPSARQSWLYPHTNVSGAATLSFAGAAPAGKNNNGTTAMCVQIDGGKPWSGNAAIVWDCQPGAKDEAVKLLPGSHGGHKLQIDMTPLGAGPLCAAVRRDLPPPPPPPPPAVPSPQQLAWADHEVGALFQYNMGTYGEQTNDEDCGPSLSDGVPLPPASSFNAPLLNVSQWMEAVHSFGGKYAVLTAQAGCGFVLYPSNASVPGHGRYNYTIRESPYKRDLMHEFVTEARKWGIKPGIYYIVNFNAYLQFAGGHPAAKPGAGTLALTVEQYSEVVLAQLRELWGGRYGQLFELWFDGGTLIPGLQTKVQKMLADLQPNAVAFQGPTPTQGIRWIGSESGQGPEPNWSAAASSVSPGPGDPDGAVFAPAEADVTLSNNGEWDWRPGVQLKSLEALTDLYDGSVGHNANFLLNCGPNYSGLLPDLEMQRYKEFGRWIQSCYATPVNATPAGVIPSASGTTVTLHFAASAPALGRISLMEDQTTGQRIRSYTVDVMNASTSTKSWEPLLTAAQSIGHKRIIRVEPPRQLAAVRLTVHKAVGAAGIRSIAAFAASGCTLPPAPPSPPCELQQNFEYTGNLLSAPTVMPNVAQCCVGCRAMGKKCVGFAFTLKSKMCALFGSTGGAKQAQGITSGAPIWLKSDS